MSLLALTAFVVIAASLAAQLTGRATKAQASAGNALGCALIVIDSARTGSTALAAVFSAMCAAALWNWWNGGGGSGTRRRLRGLRRHFRGVRRTAPKTA